MMSNVAEDVDISGQSESASNMSGQSEGFSGLQEHAQAVPRTNLEDYETQFFGFTPKSFVNGFYNAVSEYFMDALQIIEDFLQKQYSDIMTGKEVAEKMMLIRKHLVTQIDKAFDTLEVYLATNILCVPRNVVLPEDQVQMDMPVSEEVSLALQQNIQDMKDKILAVKLANEVLKQRVQHTLEVSETLDTIVEKLQSAEATAREEGVVDLRDSLSHCAQTVLSTVRLLSSIPNLTAQDGASEAKKERK